MADENAIFTGDKLLTAANDKDTALFDKQGLRPMPAVCRLAEAAG